MQTPIRSSKGWHIIPCSGMIMQCTMQPQAIMTEQRMLDPDSDQHLPVHSGLSIGIKDHSIVQVRIAIDWLYTTHSGPPEIICSLRGAKWRIECHWKFDPAQ